MDIIREATKISPAFAAKIFNTQQKANSPGMRVSNELGLYVPSRNISINTGTPVPGTCYISDAWVTLSGSSLRVNSVPVGANFNIYAQFYAFNQNGGTWTVCVTCTSSDGSIANYTLLGTSIFGGDYLDSAGKLLDGEGTEGYETNTMPAGSGALTLSFKMWLRDGLKPSTLPTRANW
jgi:hypothetical protein